MKNAAHKIETVGSPVHTGTPEARRDIMPLQKCHVPAAARLIAEAFNTAAADERKSLAESFHTAAALPHAFTFVAVENGNVAGVVRLMSYGVPQGWDGIASFSVYQLAVDPARRGRGVGHALMRHAEDFARAGLRSGQKGCIELSDWTKHNNPASRFYEKVGYVLNANAKPDADGSPVLYKYVSRPAAPLSPAGKGR